MGFGGSKRDTALGQRGAKGKCPKELGWEEESSQYLLGSRFNALVPLALLHIQVQSSHHIHTHQLWVSGKDRVRTEMI